MLSVKIDYEMEGCLKLAMVFGGVLLLAGVISQDAFASLSSQLIMLAVVGSLPWWVRVLVWID